MTTGSASLGGRRDGAEALRCAGSRRVWSRPSRARWLATTAPFSKIRISLAKTWTSRMRRRVVSRHAVEIAADAHHPLMRDAPFELENRSVGRERQRFEIRLFLGEGLVDHALRGRVDPGIGDRVEPVPELNVEIVEVAERAAGEELL